MNFVLDSSLTAAFLLEDEATTETDEILDSFGRGAIAFVPALWGWEVANLLLMAERRKRIRSADVLRHLARLKMMPIEVDDEALDQTWSSTSLLARKHQLTAYDAAYLEVAIRRTLGLGSLDTDLRKAAKTEKVPLLPKA
ncbi:MAG: type II toxin-antitoxin system VapC family toxin [Verrucomicrobiia bacterium]